MYRQRMLHRVRLKNISAVSSTGIPHDMHEVARLKLYDAGSSTLPHVVRTRNLCTQVILLRKISS